MSGEARGASPPGWSPAELAQIGGADEVEIAPQRPDGSLGQRVTVWVVPHGGGLYVRSWRGSGARWFRAVERTHRGRLWAGGLEKDVTFQHPDRDVDDSLDAVYRSKYRAHGERYVRDMVAPDARATTRRLLPR